MHLSGPQPQELGPDTTGWCGQALVGPNGAKLDGESFTGTMRSGAGERVQPIPKPEHETNTRRTTFIPLRVLLIYSTTDDVTRHRGRAQPSPTASRLPFPGRSPQRGGDPRDKTLDPCGGDAGTGAA